MSSIPKTRRLRRLIAGLAGASLLGAVIATTPSAANAATPVAHFPFNSTTVRSDLLHPSESIGGDAGTFTATHVDLGMRPHNDHIAGNTPASSKITGDTLSLSLDFMLPSAQPRATSAISSVLTYGGRTDYAQNSVVVHPYYSAGTSAAVLYQNGAAAKTITFPAPAADAWHNVVVSLDGGTGGKFSVYVDGALAGETAADGIGADEVGSQVIRIGRDKSPINILGSYRDLYVLSDAVGAADATAFADANAQFAIDQLAARHSFTSGSTVGSNLALTTGNGIQWSVPAGQTALTADGVVTRPAVGQSDAQVSLTLSYRGKQKVYALTVPARTDASGPDALRLAEYDFSQTSGTVLTDISGNGQNGTVLGGEAWSNGFMRFNGANHVKLPDGLLAGHSAATIVVESNPDALTGAQFLWNIGGSGNASTGQFFIQPVTPRLSISKTNWNGEQTATSTTPLVAGKWQSIAATIEKNAGGTTSTLRLYIDGALVAQKADSNTHLSDLTTHTFNFIGKSAYTADALHRGAISSFRVYSEALSSDDLADIAGEDAAQAAPETVASIDLAAANSQDLSAIDDNMVLPTWGGVSWTAQPAGIIAPDGTVTLPVEDTQETLTATANVRGSTATRTFDVTVLRNPSDQDRAQRDADLVALAYVDDVRASITLPEVGSRFGSALSWSSSDEAIVDTDPAGDLAPGVVTRPANADRQVTLTVTATFNGAVATRDIVVTVRKAYVMPTTTDYLFAHFTGTEGQASDEQIYFATSRDVMNWTDTRTSGNPVLSVDRSQGDGGVRDPHVVRSGEGDRFYLIATDLSIYHRGGWGSAQATTTGSKKLVVWESTDLVNWSAPRFPDVASKIPNAGMAWAPEAFWDEATQQYYVFWATRADGNTQLGDSVDVYLSTTRDFVTFTDPINWIDRSHSIIDTTMIKSGDWYYRASGDGEITIEKSKKIETPSVSATAKVSGSEDEWVLVGTLQSILNGSGDCAGGNNFTGGCLEGPELFRFNDDDKGGVEELYGLFADRYGVGAGYMPFTTTNLASTSSSDWAKRTDINLGPLKKRHGGIIPITEKEYARVMYHFAGVGEDPDVEEPVALTVSATTRCVAGKVVLAVSATNTGDAPVAATLGSSFGSKAVSEIGSGRTVSAAFTTRQVSIPAGVATAQAVDGVPVEAAYPAANCG
ncbi:MAG TPA: family 43 glycosylhydrolase [Arachnia sp.]|nr:family 43 glycosylhydrolase [Arachnia sp.]HMT85613.1 family 43 glycosylhydrolase [Arachnia sp.]